MVNKNQFKITNNKKILHKVHKHWIVISAMALALLGVSYSTINNTKVHAATLPNDSSSQQKSAVPTQQSEAQAQKQYTGSTASVSGTNVSSALHSAMSYGTPKKTFAPSALSTTSKKTQSNGIVSQAKAVHQNLMAHANLQSKEYTTLGEGNPLDNNGNNFAPKAHKPVMLFGAEQNNPLQQGTFNYVNNGKLLSDSPKQRITNKKILSKLAYGLSDLKTDSDLRTTTFNKYLSDHKLSNYKIPEHYYANSNDLNNVVSDLEGAMSDNNINGLHEQIPVSYIPSSDLTGNVAIHFITPTNDTANFKYDKKSYKYVGKPITFPNVVNGQAISFYNDLKENGDSAFNSLNKAPFTNYNFVDTKELISNNFDNQSTIHFDSDGETDNLYVLVQPKTEGTDYINYVHDGTVIKSIVNNITSNPSDIDNAVASFKNAVLRVNGKFRKLGKYNKNYAVPTNFYATRQKHFKNILKKDNTKYGQTQLNIPIKSVFAPITIHYVDANTGQKVMSDNIVSDNNSKSYFSDLDNETQSIGNDWNIDKNSSLNSNVDIKNFTKNPQAITVAYDFQNYNHPNNGKGDLDVFYFHNNKLAQYNDYGSFPNGTSLKSNAFTKQGFNIVKGNNINKFNNGTQTIVLTSNGNKTLQLPQTSDIVAPNTQDVITYKTRNGKIVSHWNSPKGYSNQSDNDAYNIYMQSDYPNLPEQYKLANGEASKYSDFMSNKSNYDYGTNNYTFTVVPNIHKLTINYVDSTNHKTIAKSDTYDITAGNPISNSINLKNIASAVRPTSKQKYDLTSAKIMDVNGKAISVNNIVPTIMPNGATSLTIGYTPKNVTLEHHNTITLNTFDKNKPVTVYSDEGVDQPFWNEFQSNVEKALKDKEPYIFNINNNEYEIPVSNPSDLNSNFIGTTLSDVTKAMNKQNDVNDNNYKQTSTNTINGTENATLTQTKNVNFTVQQISPINVYFVNTANHNKVIKQFTVKGVDGGNLDVNGNSFTINGTIPEFMPKGFELNGNRDSDGFTTKPTDNITNFNDISSYNNGNMTFSASPNNVYIAIKPIPVRAHTTITVNYLDADNNNNKIIPSTVTHGLEWQSFNDLITDEDKALPNINSKYGIYNYQLQNVDYSGIDNNKSEYGKSDQTINLIYAKTKGRININYIDRTSGNIVHTVTNMGLIGSPFNNDESYLENVPNNYYFDGVSANNVSHYSATDQNINVYMKPVKPATAERTTITVNYVDKKSGKVISNGGTTSDTASAPFDITPYTKSVPSDYHFVGFKNYTQNYGDTNTTVDVLVAKNAPKSASSANTTNSGKANNGSSASSASSASQQINGDIYLNYRDTDSGVIVKSEHFNEPINSVFALDSYVRNVPKGYKLDYTKGATNTFYYNPQTIDVYMTKLSNIPKPNNGVINISYVNAQTGKPLASNVILKGADNKAFNLNSNLKTFNNYTFDKNASKNLNINKFNNGTQYITLAYDENNCNITVEFVDNNGKVLKTIPTSAKANTPFNADNYKNNVPSGYEIKGTDGIVNMYDLHPQTFTFKVAKPSIHTITVNYIDKATGKTIFTKSATNDADTPFNIDDYISYIPSGYKWDSMPNNTVSKFDNSNHTYSIILSAIRPVQPSSASAKPSSSASASSAKNSSAKPSSAKSNSTSSASSKESSSASSAPSSKASSASSSKAVTPSSSSAKPSSKSSSASSSAITPSSKASSSASSKASSATSSQASSASSSVVTPVVPSAISQPTNSNSASVAPKSASASNKATKQSKGYKGQYTNLHYPISYGKNVDKVTYRNHKYAVRYNANGRNTINVKNGKRNKRIVVSTNEPVSHTRNEATIRAVAHVDFARPTVSVHNVRQLNRALRTARSNQVIKYGKVEIVKLAVPSHWRYFMVNKNAIAHSVILSVGSHKKVNLGQLMKKGHTLTVFIKRIYAVHDKKANYIRYEFKANHHIYWITGNDDFVNNAYYQTYNFKHNQVRHHQIKVIRNCIEYNNKHYSKANRVRKLSVGTKLNVKALISINKHTSYQQTRFILANGKYVTANKNFVKII